MLISVGTFSANVFGAMRRALLTLTNNTTTNTTSHNNIQRLAPLLLQHGGHALTTAGGVAIHLLEDLQRALVLLHRIVELALCLKHVAHALVANRNILVLFAPALDRGLARRLVLLHRFGELALLLQR
jgi:precorrin-6x reductase